MSQRAFERAWRHAGSYDPRRAGVTTWLLTITRNLAIDTVRLRRPEPIDPWVVADLLPPAGDQDPADAAVAADQMGRLRLALGRLPIEQRRAVVLATIGGRTSTEIGAIEGIPVPTAKHRLRTGLRKLRAAVAVTDGEDIAEESGPEGTAGEDTGAEGIAGEDTGAEGTGAR